MAVGDVYKLTAKQSYNAGMVVMNTYYFARKSAPDPTAANALALANNVKELFRTHQGTTIAYTDWTVDQVRGGSTVYSFGVCHKEGGIQYVGAFTGTLAGTVAGDILPPQNAFVTTLLTGLAGRRRRGRHYLCGRVEADQNVGVYIAGAVTDMTTAWNAALTQFGPTGSDGDWQIGVWSTRTATGCEPATQHPHHLTGVDAPSPATAFAAITTFAARNIVYTQRRRTVGVGM